MRRTAEPRCIFFDASYLVQSPFLDSVGEERLNEARELMNRRPGERLSHDVAREVGQQQGVKATIQGSIASPGSNGVIAVRATASQDGDALACERVDAGRKDDVLEAVPRARATSSAARSGPSRPSSPRPR